MQIISIEELDKIEQSTASQRKRQSLHLLDRISPHEKIIFCVYSSTKTGLFSNQSDIIFAILTNYRIICASQSATPANTVEIMLDRLIRAEVRGDGVWIYNDPQNSGYGYYLFISTQDKKMAEFIVTKLNIAISQSRVQARSTTVNIKQNTPENNSVADQLRKLTELHQAGILTDEEFARAKQRAIG